MLFSKDQNAFLKAALNRVAFFMFITTSLSACAETTDYAFITNQLSDDITVIDINEQQVVSTIKAGKAPAGVALSQDGNRVLITNCLLYTSPSPRDRG